MPSPMTGSVRRWLVVAPYVMIDQHYAVLVLIAYPAAVYMLLVL